MKRKLLALLLASVMVLSLVACGQKETPDTPETPDDQEEVKDYSGYTIRIYSNSNSTERTTPLTIGDHVSDARRIFIGTPQITA